MTGFSSYEDWLKVVRLSFPHVATYIEDHNLQTLVIGATLLELYKLEGWNIRLTRKTGNLNLSIQISFGGKEYLDFRSYLLQNEYKQSEPDKEFRLYPPKQKKVEYSYLDLLAHPGPGVSDHKAREVMGVGPNWTFDTIEFGFHQAISITKQISIPNLFAFLLMKFKSWESDPYNRAKDLGDIVDVVYGIVSSGQHYDLKGLWSKIMANHSEHEAALREFLTRSADPNEASINFEDYEAEFVQRLYLREELESEIPRQFEELLEALKD